jgi:glycosyltransferase involved in cell wall biosynthesis
MIGGDRFGPNSPETRFITALRPMTAAAGIAMHGYRPHADVQAALSAAAIAVVPSRWPEPFGLAALEAMAAGAALICTSQGALGDLVGEAALHVSPGDADALAQAIVALAMDAGLRAELSERGRRRAADFDLPVVAAELDRLRRAALGL